MDTVILRKLPFQLCVGRDAWGREKAQPVNISLEISPLTSLETAAAKDDVSESLDYGKLYKSLLSELTGDFYDVRTLALATLKCVPSYQEARITIQLPKAILRAGDGVEYKFEMQNLHRRPVIEAGDEVRTLQIMNIGDIRCTCIVGVNSHERLQKQIVIVSLSFELGEEHQYARPLWPMKKMPVDQYHDIVSRVAARVEASSFETIEALATAIAQTVTMELGIDAVTIQVEKPNAIASIESAGVRISREASFFAEKDFWKVKRP